MSDRTRVQNPLTIIAIFAGIAEIAGTTVLLGLPLEIQKIFVWFVISFPFLLVGAFFAVLLLNHRVLYAPSDFSNEEHFITLLKERRTAKQAIAETNDVVEELKLLTKSQDSNSEILDAVTKRLISIESELKEKASSIILSTEENKLQSNGKKVKMFRDYVDFIDIANGIVIPEKQINSLENEIVKELKHNYPTPMTIEAISNNTRLEKRVVKICLGNLIRNGFVVSYGEQGFAWWRKEE
ncbi:homeobox domain-containing protein [Paenibacillus hunanensis]|uniref:Winged helix-turn-helix domain-containing protein n=1 Tax=Paenibacillus hunanensis TaxID=539262 RepID=A0ABU1IWD7_9BACL|nr:homeobox domain-containing protein [Paenibacillus hunanensis]MDR6243531.1 hypothetical protein [Paenibacillus hunanensis]GGI98397.1 hypothetical protein GCM10008022_03950 [Paenibacillus hunanensis]